MYLPFLLTCIHFNDVCSSVWANIIHQIIASALHKTQINDYLKFLLNEFARMLATFSRNLKEDVPLKRNLLFVVFEVGVLGFGRC